MTLLHSEAKLWFGEGCCHSYTLVNDSKVFTTEIRFVVETNLFFVVFDKVYLFRAGISHIVAFCAGPT